MKSPRGLFAVVPLLILMCCGFQQRALAQLKASFTASVTSGCTPLQVTFTNTSTGNPTSFEWYVGTNTTPFTLKDPSATYVAGGDYTVKLIVYKDNEKDSIIMSNLIHVYDKPVVDFSTDVTEGCIPFTSNFTDFSSASPGGVIVARNWSFGNSTSSSAVNPTATYNTVGQFNVSLLVTDNHGCSNSKQVVKMIKGKSQPSASFSASGASACNPPVTPVFTAVETGSYIFTWTINGQTRTGNPISDVTFTSTGAYDVTLNVSDGKTCNSTTTQKDFVTIKKPVADFSFPDTICALASAKFQNLSTGGSTYIWRFFDNNQVLTNTNPIHVFAEGGSFQVKLIVTSADGICKDSISKAVEVEKTVALFSPDSFYSCNPFETITFTNNSTGAVGYEWKITPPDQVTEITNEFSPTRTYFSGVYNIRLTTNTAKGCKSVKNGKVIIKPIHILLTYDPINGGCAPVNYTFTDTTNGDYPIVSWDWDFGDGSPHETTRSVSHLYTPDGDWMVRLIVKNSKGCADTLDLPVMAGLKPEAKFEMIKDYDCPSDSVFFFDKSFVPAKPNEQLVDSWKWVFVGEDYTYEQNPTMLQSFQVGWTPVQLIAGYNGCLDTLYDPKGYFKYGPTIPYFKPDSVCVVNKQANIYMGLNSYTSAVVDFGDGLTQHFTTGVPSKGVPRTVGGNQVVDSTLIDSTDFFYQYRIEHTYANPGTYTVLVQAEMDSLVKSPYTGNDTLVHCTTRDTCEVRIPNIKAQIKAAKNDTICPATAVGFEAINYGDAIIFSWYVDYVSFVSGIGYRSISFNDSIFSPDSIRIITLKVTNESGCIDSVQYVYRIIQPEPVITVVGSPTGCVPLKLSFLGGDTSGVPIKDWVWNFGPNATPSASFNQNPGQVVYNLMGDYEVTLTATDVYGCKTQKELEYKIVITEAEAAFNFIGDSAVCLGKKLFFKNTSTPENVLDYKWILSSGDTFYTESPTLVTDTFGDFTAKLIVNLSGSCNDTVEKPFTVEPVPDVDFFAVTPVESNCYPFKNVQFEGVVSPAGFDKYIYDWSLGEGSTGGNSTAITTYFAPGEYDIKLVVSTPVGCADSISRPKLVKVRGPSATLTISDDSVCVKDQLFFLLSNLKNVESYRWDFGDGNIVPGDLGATNTVHFYTQVGDIYPVVVIKSGDCEISLQNNLFVNDVVARFKLPAGFENFAIGIDTLKACDKFNLDAEFIPSSKGYISQFEWGIPQTAEFFQDSNWVKTFGVGNYRFFLAVSDDASGCKDTIYQRIIVNPNPVALAGNDVILCKDDSIQLNGGVGNGQYSWSPGNSLSDDSVPNPWANPLITTGYQLKLVDAIGCSATDSIYVYRDQSSVQFSLDSRKGCDSLVLSVQNQSVANNYVWTFDGVFGGGAAVPNYTFKGSGKHYILLTAYDLDVKCSQFGRDTIEIFPSPILKLDTNKLICFGDSALINGQVSGTSPISISWNPTIGLSDTTKLGIYAKPDQTTDYSVVVVDKECQTSNNITVFVDKAKADFALTNDTACVNLVVEIENHSVGNIFNWSFSSKPGDRYTGDNPQHTYVIPGNYVIKLQVIDQDAKCADTVSKPIAVFPAPLVSAAGDGFMCNWDSLFISASGAKNYRWEPLDALSFVTIADSASAWTKVDSNTDYVVTGTDVHGCLATDTVHVTVQPDFTYLVPLSDTVNIGDFIHLDATADDPTVLYKWNPIGEFNCGACATVDKQMFGSDCFRVELVDNRNCYPKFSDVCIVVKENYSLDVPDAFTPNGDGRNDKIYARGAGIKKLLNFTIYNRWGQVVFQTGDINVGWDGKFKDKIQNDETYVYTVDAEMWNGDIVSRKGYITLLK